jgi:hypothetical protein
MLAEIDEYGADHTGIELVESSMFQWCVWILRVLSSNMAIFLDKRQVRPDFVPVMCGSEC